MTLRRAGSFHAPTPTATASVVPSSAPSAVGQAYLAAVAAATPGWKAVDAQMAARGGLIHREDLLAEVDADATFLAGLRAITFPAESLPAATALIQAVQDYDSFLMARYENYDPCGCDMAKDDALQQTRSNRSAHLREVLGLPASTASYFRP